MFGCVGTEKQIVILLVDVSNQQLDLAKANFVGIFDNF